MRDSLDFMDISMFDEKREFAVGLAQNLDGWSLWSNWEPLVKKGCSSSHSDSWRAMVF